MRHLAIAALLFAAACGGKSDKAGTTTPDPENEEPEGEEEAEYVPSADAEYLYGTLVSVAMGDGCEVTFIDNQSEDGEPTVWRGKLALCDQDWSDYVDAPVSLIMETCTDEADCFMLGDPTVVAIEGMAPG